MTPMVFADPWWITCIKAVGVLVFLLLFTLFNIVFERKVVAKMQHRVGPNMNGPGGWFQSLADGVKLVKRNLKLERQMQLAREVLREQADALQELARR